MKLATVKNGNPDGQLIVVNRALTQAVEVPDIAKTLQQALDDWDKVSPQLEQIYQDLNARRIPESFAFDPHSPHTGKQVAAPLPRAYQWADGSAYVNHVELVRKARGAEMPEDFWTNPLMYQGGSDIFLGPRDDIPVISEEWGIDFEAEVAVITKNIPMGVSNEQALQGIVLLMLVNDVSLRNLIPGELAKGFGFFQSKPASSFSPVAVTPDELGAAWQDGKVHLPLYSYLNETLFGQPNAGVDMTFNFPTLIAHAAKTRFLGAGSIIGSGTVSNKDNRDNKDTNRSVGHSYSVGHSCIAEKRMVEIIETGKAVSPFMKFGDRIRIEMLDENKRSIFGAIDQQVVQYAEQAMQDSQQAVQYAQK